MIFPASKSRYDDEERLPWPLGRRLGYHVTVNTICGRGTVYVAKMTTWVSRSPSGCTCLSFQLQSPSASTLTCSRLQGVLSSADECEDSRDLGFVMEGGWLTLSRAAYLMSTRPDNIAKVKKGSGAIPSAIRDSLRGMESTQSSTCPRLKRESEKHLA